MAVEEGKKAPAFRLRDADGNLVTLADFAGRDLILYFYPKDDTPGCTTEACNFRDDIFELRALGAEVLGVSLDSAESHAKFARKHGLPFPLLSDSEGVVAEKYGCLGNKLGFRYAQRHTFIIDPQGRVAKAYRDVDPKVHSRQVIADLAALQGKGAEAALR